MDILGPLRKMTIGNQFLLVKTDRCSMLTRAVPLSKATVLHAALKSIHSWVMPYNIPNFLSEDKGPQLVSKFFDAVCSFLGVEQRTKKVYHLQKGQNEWYNKTIVARLCQ